MILLADCGGGGPPHWGSTTSRSGAFIRDVAHDITTQLSIVQAAHRAFGFLIGCLRIMHTIPLYVRRLLMCIRLINVQQVAQNTLLHL